MIDTRHFGVIDNATRSGSRNFTTTQNINTAMEGLLIAGVSINLGGRDLLVPPLTLTQLQYFLPRVKPLAGIAPNQMGEEQITVLLDIVTAALQRNYPDLTKAAVGDLLDLGNAGAVLQAILAAPGAPGETPAAGPSP